MWWNWNKFYVQGNYRGFSCDIISSQLCKSSFLWLPCWFPSAWPGIAKYNKMSRYFLSSSYHNTKLRPSDKNIKTHTRLKFQILLQSQSDKSNSMFCCFSAYRTIQKGNQAVGQNHARICAYRVVQTLYQSIFSKVTYFGHYPSIHHTHM